MQKNSPKKLANKSSSTFWRNRQAGLLDNLFKQLPSGIHQATSGPQVPLPGYWRAPPPAPCHPYHSSVSELSGAQKLSPHAAYLSLRASEGQGMTWEPPRS